MACLGTGRELFQVDCGTCRRRDVHEVHRWGHALGQPAAHLAVIDRAVTASTRITGEQASVTHGGGRGGRFARSRSMRVHRSVEDVLDYRWLRESEYPRLNVVESTDGPEDHAIGTTHCS